MRDLGADRVINDKTQGVVEDGITYDMAVDTVATLPWVQARHAIRPGSKMVLIAGKTSDMLFGSLKAALQGKKMMGGVASESHEVLEAVVTLAANGEFHPLIDRKFAFADMKSAHAHVDTGHKRGNVVVSVAERAGASPTA